jgi:hypothetical protein
LVTLKLHRCWSSIAFSWCRFKSSLCQMWLLTLGSAHSCSTWWPPTGPSKRSSSQGSLSKTERCQSFTRGCL